MAIITVNGMTYDLDSAGDRVQQLLELCNFDMWLPTILQMELDILGQWITIEHAVTVSDTKSTGDFDV